MDGPASSSKGESGADRGDGFQGKGGHDSSRRALRLRVTSRKARIPDPPTPDPGGESAPWEQRCAELFIELRKPATTMITRAYGGIMDEADVEDVYAAAWASVLNALRGRAERMDDGEVRTYLLTAVATHARKELRRRGRKGTGSLESLAEAGLHDSHEPSPEELAIGAEERDVARDVLVSMPKRRRTVMLLRYGGGMSPGEVCERVDGLSPRAYRKEVTKGVEAMIDGLGQVETGEWCERRRKVVRDLAAGSVDGELKREAEAHIAHCRSCARLYATVDHQFHESAGHLAFFGGIGALTVPSRSIGERIGSWFESLKGLAVDAQDRVQEQVIGISVGGGTRGAGSVGAGGLAKVISAGAAGKAAIACAGAGAATGACLAVGIVPGVGADDRKDDPRPRGSKAVAVEPGSTPLLPPVAAEVDRAGLAPTGVAAPERLGEAGDRPERSSKRPGRRPKVTSRPPERPPGNPAVSEFDPLATPSPSAASQPTPTAPQPTPMSSGSDPEANPAPAAESGGGTPGEAAPSNSGGSTGRQEFGP